MRLIQLPTVLGSKRTLHCTAIRCDRGPKIHPGWYPRDHKPGPYPQDDEERRAAAIKYGLRPEDYKPISRDLARYSGDYPELGQMTYGNKDPYENFTDHWHLRNWGEPVSRSYMRRREPSRMSDSCLDAEKVAGWGMVRTIAFFVVPLCGCMYYTWYRNHDYMRIHQETTGMMPKAYPYDYKRAYPMQHPTTYPIANYSFQPANFGSGDGHSKEASH